MRTMRFAISLACLCAVLTACGGRPSKTSVSDSVGHDGDGANAVESGYVIGPRVEGLTVGVSKTDANGLFKAAGESTVEISLGSLHIASRTPRDNLSYFDISGAAEQYRFDTAVRISQLLISLDSDSDARNGLQLISDKALFAELDWQSSDSSWEASAASLVYRLSSGSKSLVSRDMALDTVTASLRQEDEQCVESLGGIEGFAVETVRCSDKSRMQLWSEVLQPLQMQVQQSLDALLSKQVSLEQSLEDLQQSIPDNIQHSPELAAWLSYLVASVNTPVQLALEPLFMGSTELSGTARESIDQWLSGEALAMQSRDRQERQLSALTVNTWLAYGFEQQALETSYGLQTSSRAEALLESIKRTSGIGSNLLRTAVVDEQNYRALRLIDVLMDAGPSWTKQLITLPGSDDTEEFSPVPNTGVSTPSNIHSDDIVEPARVWRVSYAPLVAGELADFVAEGSGLGAHVAIVLAGCNNSHVVAGTSDARTFSCDLSVNATGGQVLQVVDTSNGDVLYESIVSVAEPLTPITLDSSALVASVTPSSATRGSTQLFTVSGQDLPVDTQFNLAGCQLPEVISRSSQTLEVMCQLDARRTVRSGSIEDADGNEIYQFTVSPVVESELSVTIDNVAPSAALEASTTAMVISGKGFAQDAAIVTSACAEIEISTQSDTQIEFNCIDAQLGTWPLHLESGRQSVIAPLSIQVRAVEATVNAVTPNSAVEGEWVNIQVQGLHLSEGTELEFDACDAVEVLNGSTVLRQFGCTLKESGIQEGTVTAGGRVLYRFDMAIEAAQDARAIQVFPTESTLGERLEITVSGTGLSDDTVLLLDGCRGMTANGASNGYRMFSCMPQQTGPLNGQVLADGEESAAEFTIEIVDAEDPLDFITIDSISPASSFVGAKTTFTVRGEGLPTSLTLSIDGCSKISALGGDTTQRQFRCELLGAPGEREILVQSELGGKLLGTFEFLVTGGEPVVTDVTPTGTAIGVSTQFRITGYNLDTSVWLELEGCQARGVTSSAVTRVYRCTPEGAPGPRLLKIHDNTTGTLLYSESVNFLPAT